MMLKLLHSKPTLSKENIKRRELSDRYKKIMTQTDQPYDNQVGQQTFKVKTTIAKFPYSPLLDMVFLNSQLKLHCDFTDGTLTSE